MGHRRSTRSSSNKLSAIWIVLAAWMFSYSAHATSSAFQVEAQINRLGTRLIFPTIPSSQLRPEVLATMQLRFQGGALPDPKNISLAVNGLLPCHGIPIASISHWDSVSGQAVLEVDVGKLYFDVPYRGRQISFADYVIDLQRYGGRMSIWIRAPRSVAAARLVFNPTAVARPPVARFTKIEPPGLVVETSEVKFSFDSDRPEAHFQCRVDDQSFKNCTSPQTLSFENGYHRFAIRGIGPEGLFGPVASYQFLVRVPAPAIEITSVSPSEKVTTADKIAISFRFTGAGYPLTLPAFTETSRYAECRIDAGSYVRCNSPVIYRMLADGDHSVDIRRVSTHLYILRSVSLPTTYRWRIDRKVPVLSWLETPVAYTRETSAHFVFESDVSAIYECRVDGGAAQVCQTTVDLTSLSEGAHSIEVVARSSDGSASLPLTYHWQVDTTAPMLKLTSVVPQQNPTNIDTLSASFESSESVDAKCFLNDVALPTCVSPVQLSQLSEGEHVLRIGGADRAGNAAEPISYTWVVDKTLPTLTIQMISPPRLPTQSTSATFRFIPSEQATFSCQLDAQAATACNSELSLTGLGEGAHTLTVTPIDVSGNQGIAASFVWEIDLTAPELKITGISPDQSPTASTSIRFEFEASEPAQFTCALDGAGAQPCDSPWLLNGLADGEHRASIVALDAAGNQSAPAEHVWTVSTIANVVISKVSPDGALVAQNSIAFEFASADSSQYQCVLDAAAPVVCTSPQTYSSLADGIHNFEVRALNLAHQPGPPAAHAWTIDTHAPVIQIQSLKPDWSPTSSGSLQVTFTSDEPASFDCKLDGAAIVGCASPLELNGLADGAHQLEIRGTDPAGNVGTAWVYQWTVDSSALFARDTSVLETTTTMARVGWRTNFPANSAVEYTEENGPTSVTTPVVESVTSHSVVVSGLKPLTLYTVRGVSVDKDGRTAYSEPISFRTRRSGSSLTAGPIISLTNFLFGMN